MGILELDEEWQLPISAVTKAKLAASNDIQTNYLAIKFRYNEIIVSYEKGMILLDALSNVETVSSEIAWDYLKVLPVNESESISFHIVSKTEYVNMKMRHLLKIKEKPKSI